MTEFRWMAPIRVGFTTAPGIMDRAPEDYRDFWERVEGRTRHSSWTMHRASPPEDARVGWSRADADTLQRPLEVASGRIDPGTVPELHGLTTTELSWQLFDHGVLLVEGRFRTSDEMGAATLRDSEHWETAVQRAGRELTRRCATTDYSFLVQQMRHYADSDRYVRLEDRDLGEPLWVTRALVLDPEDPRGADLARRWVSGIDAEHRTTVEELIDGRRPVLAQWMNHVHRSDRVDAVEHSWSALEKAQFFWSAMHWVDQSLREILAWTESDRGDHSVKELRHELRTVMAQAQELFMLRADVCQQVSRRTHEEMQRFLAFWEYDELLEGSVREKVDICKERLTSLAEDRAARSAMFTDIILMSIGVTSVLATAIALVQFGRGAGQDPSQSVFDLGNGSITSWLSSQSMDAILIISLLLSIVLVTVFIWKRRQSVS